ncbi:protein draper-like [Saccostrea cucullata]|uniref:protein draper-like n=1 Tax=Saccostrea cuccullata TaxID=36930 RepID=UPI002ED62E9C
MKRQKHFVFLAVLLCDFICMPFTDGVCNRDPFRCCVNHYQVNLTCVQCPLGTYGINCSENCPENYYGKNCAKKCNCSDSHICDIVNGCTLVNTVSDYGLEMDPDDDDDGIQPGVLASVMISLIVCLTSIIAVSVFLYKRRNIFRINNKHTSRQLAKPYVIKDLTTLNDSPNEKDDAMYSEVIRDINKKQHQSHQHNQGTVSTGNIYSTHIILDSAYDKLQFHPTTETILRENELYGANI